VLQTLSGDASSWASAPVEVRMNTLLWLRNLPSRQCASTQWKKQCISSAGWWTQPQDHLPRQVYTVDEATAADVEPAPADHDRRARGAKLTLRVVAKYAIGVNAAGTVENCAPRGILAEH